MSKRNSKLVTVELQERIHFKMNDKIEQKNKNVFGVAKKSTYSNVYGNGDYNQNTQTMN